MWDNICRYVDNIINKYGRIFILVYYFYLVVGDKKIFIW